MRGARDSVSFVRFLIRATMKSHKTARPADGMGLLAPFQRLSTHRDSPTDRTRWDIRGGRYRIIQTILLAGRMARSRCSASPIAHNDYCAGAWARSALRWRRHTLGVCQFARSDRADGRELHSGSRGQIGEAWATLKTASYK